MNGGVTVHDLLDEALILSGLSDLFAYPWVGICLVNYKPRFGSFSIAGPKIVFRHTVEPNRAACYRT
jgi:hypothetical protein